MKTAHIISHTHWDREWYLPYEQHHMRLIMLIDQILHAIETDPEFTSFHLDGQTICIDDYLQVKPQNREKLLKAIADGKIKIGPWYILQDAFLTSAEANVRNGYYGDLDCRRYGKKNSVGYYPDTFGIYAQAPQIMQELEIDNLIFGRGVSTTGFNNEVANDFESKYSEMKLTASNGTSVLGILFANWYSNGNEIPTTKLEAKAYWDQKIKECEQYTNLNHLLLMNGCDHTPYQSDVTTAIAIANELYEDIQFKQSSFEEYLAAVKSEIEMDDLTTITGELTSQMTNGLYTLVNTASSRINQKIKNATIQDSYEYLAEPLGALYAEQYMHSELEYGWKKLMQNHPHDSICGCSVDSVHDSMDARFEDSQNVATHIIDHAIKQAVAKLDAKSELAFTVFNPTDLANTKHEVTIEYKRQEFGSDFQAARDNMKRVTIPNLGLFDTEGNEIRATITDEGIGFDYYLPDEKFRRPYFSRNIKVQFNYQFKHIGHQTFYIKPVSTSPAKQIDDKYTLENENIKVNIGKNGSFEIVNKHTNRVQTNLLEIIDHGDIGNEYMFGRIENDKNITIKALDKIEILDTQSMEIRRVSGVISIPQSADEQLLIEQIELIEYNTRNAQRSAKMIDIPISITYSLDQYDTGVKLKIDIDNQAKDHRMRARFKLSNNSDTHFADSAFEIVKRNNEPLANWENPSNDQRMQKFVKLTNNVDSLLVATHGLHEYEVRGDYLEITLQRHIGELGDWGYFPTPKAQCLETASAELYVVFDESKNDNLTATKLRSIFVKQPIAQIYAGTGELALNQQMLNITHDQNCYISSIKRNQSDDLIIRLGSNGATGKFNIEEKIVRTNMLEKVELTLEKQEVKANEILTIKVLT